MGKGRKHCIHNFWEREFEAGFPGNGWEREFPLTPAKSTSLAKTALDPDSHVARSTCTLCHMRDKKYVGQWHSGGQGLD